MRARAICDARGGCGSTPETSRTCSDPFWRREDCRAAPGESQRGYPQRNTSVAWAETQTVHRDLQVGPRTKHQ